MWIDSVWIGASRNMKPLGTITMYFPFIADETKKVLESTMKEAYNFMDFSKLLCDRACSEESSDELAELRSLANQMMDA
jgi:hypothetical protein